MPLLSPEEIAKGLANLPGWEYRDNALHKEFSFPTFKSAMAFVNRVAELAQEARHHPDILISFRRVKLSLATHSEGGVIKRDLSMAGDIEKSVSREPELTKNEASND